MRCVQGSVSQGCRGSGEGLGAHLEEVADGQRDHQEGADDEDKRNHVCQDETCAQVTPQLSHVKAYTTSANEILNGTGPHALMAGWITTDGKHMNVPI